MTVGELKEELDGYGDHLPVHVVMSLTGHPTDDESVVQIEIADTPSAIKR